MTTPAPPPPMGQPPMGGPQQPQNTQGLIALILGIAAIPLVCCVYIGALPGIAAIILGRMGMQKADQGLATNRGMALAGMICGIVAVVLAVILFILSLVAKNLDIPGMTTP